MLSSKCSCNKPIRHIKRNESARVYSHAGTRALDWKYKFILPAAEILEDAIYMTARLAEPIV